MKIYLSRRTLWSILFFLMLSSAPFVACSTEDKDVKKVGIRLNVDVLDVDPHQSLAIVRIRVNVDNYPYNVTRVKVFIGGGRWIEVLCRNTEPWRTENWAYQGESNETTYLMIGQGESFPFDSYYLTFRIYDTALWIANFSLDTKEVYADYGGPKRYSLINQWRSPIPIQSISDKEVVFRIERTFNSSVMVFLETIITFFY